VRRFLFGNFYRNEDGSWFVKTPRWERTLWGYDAGPNNQVLFSVLARLSHGPPDTTGENPSAFYFSGAKIRFPSYLATVLTIPAAACLLAVLGFARGAPAMAFALALHPWIIRHGSDARGYGLMMLLGVCCVLSLAMALRGRRSPVWWIANGLSQFLLLYAHLGGIYLLFPLNLAAFWTLWAPFSTPGRRNPFRIADLWRLGGACLIGASVFLQAMLPNLLQLPRWLAGGRLTGKTDPDVLKNWPFDWAFGTPLMSWDEANPNALTVHDLFSRSPISTAAVAGLSGVLLILGIHALWQKADRGRLWALALLLPAPLMFADAFRSSKILYPWYTVGYLPLAWIVVGAGFACLFDRFSRQRFLTPVLTMGWVAAFALATAPQRNLVREKSVEPLAESVRVTREVVNPFHPRIGEVLTVELVHATALYDPTMRRIKSDDDFVAALREADREGKPLFVNAANLGIGRPIYPKAFALIEDPAVFEEPIVLHGLQNPCTRYVFRYRPGGLSRHGTK
ncbi:MAG: hypothetical protein KDM91_17895, partial [Verrucomicrobiae bacterium]|nr:hypothetical protein [Verrucomicrobiae bacterium]